MTYITQCKDSFSIIKFQALSTNRSVHTLLHVFTYLLNFNSHFLIRLRSTWPTTHSPSPPQLTCDPQLVYKTFVVERFSVSIINGNLNNSCDHDVVVTLKTLYNRLQLRCRCGYARRFISFASEVFLCRVVPSASPNVCNLMKTRHSVSSM